MDASSVTANHQARAVGPHRPVHSGRAVGGLGQRLAEAIRGSSDMSRTAQQPGATGEWPVVPPVPTPTPPPPAPPGPEPPIINQVSLIAAAVPAAAPADRFAPP